MDNKIFNEENKRLKLVLNKVKKAEKVLSQSLLTAGKGNLERLIELRESPETVDFAFFMEQLSEKNTALNLKDRFRRLEELGMLQKEPYFSRIDLYTPKSAKTDEIYIGKFGYTEKKPIITDWRAKIASIYYRYRYPQKNVYYGTSYGMEKRDLTLKRTFDVENGKLLKYYSNDIQLDEESVIAEKISRRKGGVLEDIVTTIQKSQLDVIEADPRQVCIVQGCVGSGKSTVAIHKLSHIFFNYPRLIKPERSVLIAKNQILVGYLSTLFPKLGLFDIQYKTLKDLVYNITFREELGIKINFDNETDLNLFGLTEKNRVDALIQALHKEIEDKLIKIHTDPELFMLASFKYSREQTPYENLSEAVNEMEEELAIQEEEYKQSPNSPKSWLNKENIRILKKILRELRDFRINLKEYSLKEIIKTFGIDPTKELSYKDGLLYIYIYSQVVKLSKILMYEYCVIDEGQDFSILEYCVLNNVVLRGRFAIFGDLNQSITESGLAKWDDVYEVIKGAKQANLFELNTNYRSTKQIISFANGLLSPYTQTYLPKSIERHGCEPLTKKIHDRKALLEEIIASIKKDASNLNKSVGVICFGREVFIELSESLRVVLDKNLIVLNEKEKITYTSQAVYLMTNDLCKGLEFSKVYVVDCDMSGLKSFDEAKKAFVAVTRAMNELVVLS